MIYATFLQLARTKHPSFAVRKVERGHEPSEEVNTEKSSVHTVQVTIIYLKNSCLLLSRIILHYSRREMQKEGEEARGEKNRQASSIISQ